MPEGDTIFRAARTLDRALAGQAVTAFGTVFPHLDRVDHTAPLAGREVVRVESRGKHLLIWFSGNLVLRTHMRMNGSWHIYRPGERWRRPRHDMRIVIETAGIHAVGFSIPVAEFIDASELERAPAVRDIGPDLLSGHFDSSEAIRRLTQRSDMEIADALLDQRAVAGIGNVYKSEVLFAARINPFTPAAAVPADAIEKVLSLARRFMSANVQDGAAGTIVTYTGMRRTTGRMDASERLWVYGRAGKPCRRCGTPIMRAKQGPHVRSTYWCPRCQPPRTG
jgi:endonuclease-8